MGKSQRVGGEKDSVGKGGNRTGKRRSKENNCSISSPLSEIMRSTSVFSRLVFLLSDGEVSVYIYYYHSFAYNVFPPLFPVGCRYPRGSQISGE
jgi:hypothetical protein